MNRNSALLGLALTTAAAWGTYAWFDTAPEPVVLQSQTDIFSFVQPLQQTEAAVPAADPGTNRPYADIAVLKRIFDYHLVTAGEKPVADIRQDIDQELVATLPAEQITVARELLDRYLGYKTALVARWRGNTSTVAQMQAFMLAMRDLRGRYFGETEVRILFADDDAADSHELARLRIMQDNSLSEEARDARLLGLEATVTPQLQQAREERDGVIRLRPVAIPDASTGDTDDGVYRVNAMH